MIQLTPHMRILMATEPIDFRTGIDRLVALCRERLAADPFGGGLFVFGNRRRTALRVLCYDGQGFWLCQKRLSTGRFNFWPQGANPSKSLDACELTVLFMGGNPNDAKAAPAWRPLRMAA